MAPTPGRASPTIAKHPHPQRGRCGSRACTMTGAGRWLRLNDRRCGHGCAGAGSPVVPRAMPSQPGLRNPLHVRAANYSAKRASCRGIGDGSMSLAAGPMPTQLEDKGPAWAAAVAPTVRKCEVLPLQWEYVGTAASCSAPSTRCCRTLAFDPRHCTTYNQPSPPPLRAALCHGCAVAALWVQLEGPSRGGKPAYASALARSLHQPRAIVSRPS